MFLGISILTWKDASFNWTPSYELATQTMPYLSPPSSLFRYSSSCSKRMHLVGAKRWRQPFSRHPHECNYGAGGPYRGVGRESFPSLSVWSLLPGVHGPSNHEVLAIHSKQQQQITCALTGHGATITSSPAKLIDSRSKLYKSYKT